MEIKDQLLLSKKPTGNKFKAFYYYDLMHSKNAIILIFFWWSYSEFAILTHHEEKR